MLVCFLICEVYVKIINHGAYNKPLHASMSSMSVFHVYTTCVCCTVSLDLFHASLFYMYVCLVLLSTTHQLT